MSTESLRADGRTLAARPARRSAVDGTVSPHLESSPLSYGLAVLFVLLLYANPALLLPQLDAVRPTQWVGLAALLAMVAERVVTRRSFRLPWPQGHAVMVFLGVALLSSFGALWPRYALENSLDLARFVAIYFVLVNVVDGYRRVEGLLLAMVVGGLFPALGSLHGGWVEAMGGTRAGWVGIFENPNDLAYSLVLLVPLASLLTCRPSLLWRLAGWLVAAVFIAALLVTYSRSGLLALVAVLGILALRSRRASLKLLFLAGVGVAALFVTAFWARDQGFTNLLGDATFLQRLGTVRAGLAMFLDRPLLGVGLGCSVIGWPLYAPADVYFDRWLHNHNTFVQVLSETGALGFMAFVVVLLASFWYLRHMRDLARRRSDRRLTTLSTALEASLWGFIVCGMAGGYALSWFPYLLFGLTAAAFRVATERQGAAPRDRETRGSTSRDATPPDTLPERAPCGAPEGLPAGGTS